MNNNENNCIRRTKKIRFFITALISITMIIGGIICLVLSLQTNKNTSLLAAGAALLSAGPVLMIPPHMPYNDDDTAESPDD